MLLKTHNTKALSDVTVLLHSKHYVYAALTAVLKFRLWHQFTDL